MSTETDRLRRNAARVEFIACMNKDDISGGFKLLLGVVFGISFIAFASSIVNSVFSFSGAVL